MSFLDWLRGSSPAGHIAPVGTEHAPRLAAHVTVRYPLAFKRT